MDLTPANAARFRQRLLRWAKAGLRDYPWRQTKSPYRLLLSELMLRRTRADQVVPIYIEFFRRYPSVAAFCSAKPEDIRTLLRPLGLAWRIEGIIHLRRELAALPRKRVPTIPDELMTLTGVGEYVANAVASFSGSSPQPIIDTNVVRVLGRVFGLRLDGEARRRNEMRTAAKMCLSKRSYRNYNYAILDFAALVCTASAPSCGSCPMKAMCSYAGSNAGPCGV